MRFKLYLDEKTHKPAIELTNLKGKLKSNTFNSVLSAWQVGQVFYKEKPTFNSYHRNLPGIEARLSQNEDEYQSQETYLGYSPKKDMFYSGFDVWKGQSENYSGMVMFKLDDNHKAKVVKVYPYYNKNDQEGPMWYDNNGGGYQRLQNEVKDLVDIRLD